MTGDDILGGLGCDAYSLICSRDGVTAREIARELGADRKQVNRLLYGYPFIRDLCYRDDDYLRPGLVFPKSVHASAERKRGRSYPLQRP